MKGRDWLAMGLGALLAFASVGIAHIVSGHQTPVPYQPAGISAPWVPSTVTHWAGPINAAAKKYDVDANLLAILMTMESGGEANAKSEAGAVGLMQITPPTAGDIAKRYLKKPVSSYSLADPDTSIEFGAAYLAYLRTLFGSAKQGPDWNSTVELIAAAYNGGPGAAASLEHGTGLHDVQTVVYSRDAFNMWRERKSTTSPTFDRWKERGGSTLLDAAKASQTK